jgi:hypothetical protein
MINPTFSLLDMKKEPINSTFSLFDMEKEPMNFMSPLLIKERVRVRLTQAFISHPCKCKRSTNQSARRGKSTFT